MEKLFMTDEQPINIASKLRYHCFNHEDTMECNKLVDYYSGDQEKYVKAMLDGSYGGGYGKRRDWATRGIIPRFRNFTKSVVDKSAMVFNQAPTLETYKGLGTKKSTEVPNPVLDSIMVNSDWLPFWQNVASLTRLLKSVVVYNQKYIPNGSVTEDSIYKYNEFNGDSLKQVVLHHGNSEVVMDGSGRFVVELAYLCDEHYECETMCNLLGPAAESPKCYMVVTPSTIEKWMFYKEKDHLVDIQPNPEGFVAAFFVYDSGKPFYGSWCKPGIDLGLANEIINLSMTDTEFAVAWQKNQTLFTNGTFAQNNSPATMVPAAMPGHTAPGAIYDQINSFQNNGQPAAGGLGSVVQVVSDDNSRDPFVKFDGPDSDLTSVHAVIGDMVQDIAHDWSVNIQHAGSGSANSGFQLVVEEMDGLNLRALQCQYYQAAFRIMYEMLRRMYPELPEGTLLVSFADPQLPVNEKEREENWISKISSNRASVVDYFRESEGLTEEEAVNRAMKVKAYNEMFKTQSEILNNSTKINKDTSTDTSTAESDE